MMKIWTKSYRELIELETFEERFDYLNLNGVVGEETFGQDRFLNQALYKSRRWRSLRNQILIRDDGCDMALSGFYIHDKVIVHHINPVTQEQIENEDPMIFSPENLVCVSSQTHLAIHFGNESMLPKVLEIRKPGDTCPWK